MNKINPFKDYGTIVHGERFIGREKFINDVHERIYHNSLSIVGLPRIGKSSLAWQAVITQKNSFIERKTIPIWIDVSIFEDAVDFFITLVSKCIEEIKNNNLPVTGIKKYADLALKHNLRWLERLENIQGFFGRVRGCGFQILYILDEFDHASKLFKSSGNTYFNTLRTLCYNPDHKIILLTVSRRSLWEIQSKTKSTSAFANIFQEIYLGMFEKNEVEEYYKRLGSTGIKTDSSVKDKIFFYCGAFPYLLDLLGHELVKMHFREGDIDIDGAAQNIMKTILGGYETIKGIMEEEEINIFNDLLQALFGPGTGKLPNVEKLVSYGLIMKDEEGSYQAYSSHFNVYLSFIEREGNYGNAYPVWQKTERSLRKFITKKMTEEYGEQWDIAVENKHPNNNRIVLIFQKCRTKIQNEKKTFGDRASNKIMDHTAKPWDLFNIILAEWKVFQPIFKKDKYYWKERARILDRARHPYSHSRDVEGPLQESEKQIFEGYCNEILEILGDSSI